MDGNTGDGSAFEAKTRWSELLRETKRGRSFVIRRRGTPVARCSLRCARSRSRMARGSSRPSGRFGPAFRGC